ncbi:MAG TPA: hypothetical protein VG838_08280 [Opitutaceae bacterium]|nr:hypothetical protein [Opitutaceae bacterium]
MTRVISLFLPLLLALSSLPLGAAEPVPAAAFAARAKQTRDRLDLLFRHHNEPAPAPGPNQNPFRPPAGTAATTPVAANQTEEPAAIPTSDDLLLKQAVGALKITGIVKKLDGEINVTINGELYKEGGIITARAQGSPLYLRIRRISANSVTFGWNDSEIIQPF